MQKISNTKLKTVQGWEIRLVLLRQVKKLQFAFRASFRRELHVEEVSVGVEPKYFPDWG